MNFLHPGENYSDAAKRLAEALKSKLDSEEYMLLIDMLSDNATDTLLLNALLAALRGRR